MATRVPISWVILFVLLGVMAFFGYHILQASYSPKTNDSDIQFIESKKSVSFHPDVHQDEQIPEPRHALSEHTPDDIDAPVVTHSIPRVPGQTEQDLRATRQVQQTPPSVQYDSPEAADPLNRTVHMDAEFGSNLRHPEQMIERRPSAGIAGIVPSGLGSENSHPGNNNPVMYAPEMAQNGGEFMNGISAFDGNDGVGYSMI